MLYNEDIGDYEMKTKTIAIRISQETARQLTELGQQWGETQSDVIRRTIQNEYNREIEMSKLSNYDRAANKVAGDPDLAAHSDFILADWPEGDEHWTWVIKASKREILEWVEAGS